MTARIPLPSISENAESTAHPFPFQAGFQTLEFIQGSIFYTTVADLSAGEFVRKPGATDKLKKMLINGGLPADEWDSCWKYLNKYRDIFEH